MKKKVLINFFIVIYLITSVVLFAIISDENAKNFLKLTKLREDICIIDASEDDTIQKKEQLSSLLLTELKDNIRTNNYFKVYNLLGVGLSVTLIVMNIKQK